MSVQSLSSQFQPSTAMQQKLQDQLTSALKNNGLSSDTAKSVSSELSSVLQSAASGSSTPPDKTSIRAAIDKQVSADVKSGKLTQDQADAVTKTFDQLDKQGPGGGQSGGAPPSGPPPSGPPPGGGDTPSGSKGESSTSTGSSTSSSPVISTSSTTSGGVTTTITTHADGTKTTKTSYGASSNTTAKIISNLLASNSTLSLDDKTKTSGYLATLLSKNLIDTKA